MIFFCLSAIIYLMGMITPYIDYTRGVGDWLDVVLWPLASLLELAEFLGWNDE